MRKIEKYIAYGGGIFFAALIGIASYARIWEYKQPKKNISGASITSIESYRRSGDLHWSVTGNRIFIEGEPRPIDFPDKKWDDTVQEGDTVDLVVRRSFHWFGLANELDGLSIDDYK